MTLTVSGQKRRTAGYLKANPFIHALVLSQMGFEYLPYAMGLPVQVNKKQKSLRRAHTVER